MNGPAAYDTRPSFRNVEESTTAREPDVRASLNELNSIAADCTKCIDLLVNRLSPVMRDEPSPVAANGDRREGGGRCVVSSDMKSVSRDLHNVVAQMRLILDRLEI